MTINKLSDKALSYLHYLCTDIPTRRVGSQGNRDATDYFASKVLPFGFRVESSTFDCIDWSHEGADLMVGGYAYKAFPSPYTMGCEVSGPLMVVSTMEELEAAKASGKVLLMRDEIAREQIMPKNFPFYNPDHHRQTIELLETKQPAAIVASTTQDVGMAGAISPFPLFEDGDFDIPSVYMNEDEGNRLLEFADKLVSLKIRAKRTPSSGRNVIARKGNDHNQRVVIFAHIDAKEGTPGAIDNATGVAILLLLAEMLTDYVGQIGVEIVALNGEDYYAASGEKLYVSKNEGKFHEIVLGINLDGVGYTQRDTAYSLYDCPSEIESLVHKTFSMHKGFVQGEPWYQSDHSLFLMHQRPALALTSANFTELWTKIAHTPKDTPEIVDPEKLVIAAAALRELLSRLEN